MSNTRKPYGAPLGSISHVLHRFKSTRFPSSDGKSTELADQTPVQQSAQSIPLSGSEKSPTPQAAITDHVAPNAANKPNAKALPAQPTFEERRKQAFIDVCATVQKAYPHVNEPRPKSVSLGTQTQIESAIAAGAEIIANRPGPDLDNGFIVGLDFGTSSAKIAVRQPYLAGDPVVALVVPAELRSGDHPYLWQSVVWFEPSTGRFSLTPQPDAMPIDGFKAGLIAAKSNDLARKGCEVTRAEAAVAFIALQLAHLLGHYAAKRPLGPDGGDHFLSVQIGIPVSVCDDSKVLSAFSRVISAAHSIVPSACNLGIGEVRNSLRNAPDSLPSGFALIPELNAAIAGYLANESSSAGAHMLVDVGASTLDIVTFNIVSREKISIFTAGVEMLGASALGWALAEGIEQSTFKDACDHQFNNVFKEAYSEARAPSLFHHARRSRDVQLIITGGGCATDLHRAFIDEMPRTGVLGQTPLLRPVPPSRMVGLDCDISRLLLAFGLTRDEGEIAACRLPSQIPNLPSGMTGTLPSMVTKDQM